MCFSELKRRLKAEKKAADKEAKIKDQVPQNTEANDKQQQHVDGLDEETLDPNVSHLCLPVDQQFRQVDILFGFIRGNLERILKMKLIYNIECKYFSLELKALVGRVTYKLANDLIIYFSLAVHLNV